MKHKDNLYMIRTECATPSDILSLQTFSQEAVQLFYTYSNDLIQKLCLKEIARLKGYELKDNEPDVA